MDSKTDLAGRVVTALIDFHGQRFQIINVYGPNKHRARELFFDNLSRFKYPNIEAIVVMTSGEAMTVLETGLSRSYTLSQRHSL